MIQMGIFPLKSNVMPLVTDDETVIGTAKEFANAAGLVGTKGYVETTGLIRYLNLVGLATEVGVAPAKTNGKGGGKGPKLWKIPKNIAVSLRINAEDFKKTG